MDRFLARNDVVAICARIGRAALHDGESVGVRATARGRRDARAGLRYGSPSAQVIDGALASLPTPLSDEQAAVVRAIATSGNAVDVVEALAGTGKTTVAGALAAVYERAGYRVVGASPTGRAARELSSRAGVPASTLHRLADASGPRRGVRIGTGGVAGRRGRHGPDPGQRQRAGRCPCPGGQGGRGRRLGSALKRRGGRVARRAFPAARRARAARGRAAARFGRAPRAGRAAPAPAGRLDRAQTGARGAGGSPRRPAGGPGGGHGRLAGRRGRGGDRAGDHDRPRQRLPARGLNHEARAWRESRGELGERITVGNLEVAVGRPRDRPSQRPRRGCRQRHPRHRARRSTSTRWR